jgi:hypothetical protein
MPTIERNLTDMLRSSGEVLREAEHQDVVLRRRDGADVMLVDFGREQSLRQSLAAAARIVAEFDDAAPKLLEGVANGLPAAIPWTQFLPDTERVTFLREFAATAAACVDADVFEPLARLNDEWRLTAAIYADPALEAVLREPADEEDLGLVPRPNA